MEKEKDNQKKLEEFACLIIERQSGIHLDEKQEKFLRLIKKQGVCIYMTKEARDDKEFQKLIGLLSDMYKNRAIPIFQVVEVR